MKLCFLLCLFLISNNETKLNQIMKIVPYFHVAPIMVNAVHASGDRFPRIELQL